MSTDAPAFFAKASEFRNWLTANAEIAATLTVGFYKVGSGKPSMSWPESVDEALCFGWIDGVRKRIDDESYLIRFTPRKKTSFWSAVNIARVQALQAEGRMQPAGLAAFAHRTERRSGIYAYEQQQELKFTAAEQRLFKQDRTAWEYFQTVAPSYRKTMTYWVLSAKQAATRQRRLAKLIAGCARGERLLP